MDERLDIPVFHEDQQGTAAAVLAALTNGLKVAGKGLSDATVVVAGPRPGRAGRRAAAGGGGRRRGDRLRLEGRRRARPRRRRRRAGLDRRAHQRRRRVRRGGRGVLAGARRLRRHVGAGPALRARTSAAWPPTRSCSRSRCPTPRSSPRRPRASPRVYATGRPDVPNQINSGIASPGIWRGALDCRATEINQAMTLAAATAIAETVEEEGGLSRGQRGALDLQPEAGAERGRRGARRRRGDRRGPGHGNPAPAAAG